jgi:hypothetical protein
MWQQAEDGCKLKMAAPKGVLSLCHEVLKMLHRKVSSLSKTKKRRSLTGEIQSRRWCVKKD